jgi:hypothetical protein
MFGTWIRTENDDWNKPVRRCKEREMKQRAEIKGIYSSKQYAILCPLTVEYNTV